MLGFDLKIESTFAEFRSARQGSYVDATERLRPIMDDLLRSIAPSDLPDVLAGLLALRFFREVPRDIDGALQKAIGIIAGRSG